MKAWVGDRLVPLASASVPVADRGFTNGDGCFETLKVVDGVPFALTRHLARLRRSLAALDIAMPAEDLLREAAAAVVAANGPGVGRVRITVTPGTVVVLTGPPRVLDPAAKVLVGPWVRNERSPLTGVKATSYAENTLALRWAEARGGTDALFPNTRGELCEGAGTNVFVVVDGRLRTPPLSSGCLAGVTRELVCELVEVDEAPVPMGALTEATEAFVTSSTRDVQAVGDLDGRTLPAPGPVTASVQAAWAAMVARTLDP